MSPKSRIASRLRHRSVPVNRERAQPVPIKQPPAGPTATGRPPNETITVLTTSSAFFMIILDTSIVNLALPSIGTELGSDLVGLQWIVDGYALVFASLLLSAGSLADRYGAKRVFMTGLAIFTVASVLCGVSPTMSALRIFRILQGVGAALMLPTSLALLNHAIDEPDRRTGPSRPGPVRARWGSRLARFWVAHWSKRSAGAASLRSTCPLDLRDCG